MGAEEGKKVWGVQEWRRIVARVRSGAVWDEAIAAYGGEGRIDGDVVNALYGFTFLWPSSIVRRDGYPTNWRFFV